LDLDAAFGEARAWYAFTYVLEIDSGLSNDTASLYKAEEELRRALNDAPRTARVYSCFEALYLYQGRKELIPEAARKALAINPREVDAEIFLANYYASNNDNASATSLLRRLIKDDPLFFPARMNIADILRTEGNTAGAIAELKKILEQAPLNTYASQKLARAYLEAKELKPARAILETLPAGDRKNYEIKLNWALLLVLEGKKTDALREMDVDTMKYASLAFWSTSVAAEVFALMGNPSQALDFLEMAARNGDERDDWFRRDPFLASVRDLPKFKQIIRSIADRRRQRGGVSPGASR
jgi:Tfp pilus assembly protein PilF